MANSLNLDVYKGASASWRVVARDSLGNPLNLSGYVASGALLCNAGASSILLDLNPQVHPSYSSGIVDISLSGYQTSTLPVTQGYYSIYVMQNSGVSYNFLRGYINIYP